MEIKNITTDNAIGSIYIYANGNFTSIPYIMWFDIIINKRNLLIMLGIYNVKKRWFFGITKNNNIKNGFYIIQKSL